MIQPSVPTTPNYRCARVGCVDVEEFWGLLESAQVVAEPADGVRTTGDAGQAIANEIVSRLAPLGTDAVLSFADHFAQAKAAVDRWDVWAAGHLIANGCSDDGFSDFKAGVVAAGREWHRRVVADPDSLADHPAVRRAAVGGDPYVMFAEALNYVPSHAFERITGDDHAYWNLLEQAPRNDDHEPVDMGERFPFHDDELRRRLPRLAAMFRPNSSR